MGLLACFNFFGVSVRSITVLAQNHRETCDGEGLSLLSDIGRSYNHNLSTSDSESLTNFLTRNITFI